MRGCVASLLAGPSPHKKRRSLQAALLILVKPSPTDRELCEQSFPCFMQACLHKGGRHKKSKARSADCLSDFGKASHQRIAVATEAERNAEFIQAFPKCSSVDEVSAASQSFLSPTGATKMECGNTNTPQPQNTE